MARGRPAKCPYCGGNSINKGYRNTKTMGKRRIKVCKDCCRKFTPKAQRPVEEPPTALAAGLPATAQMSPAGRIQP